MSAHHEVIVPPGWEETFREYRLAPARRTDGRLYLSGHTGDPHLDVEGQIRSAFEDVAATLRLAGSSWRDVVWATSYHVGLREHLDVFIGVHNEYVVDPYPAWTGIGVTEIANGSIVEITVIAEPDGT